MPARIEIFDSVPLLAHAAAKYLARAIALAIDERGWCQFALPGGPFVRPIYTELAQFQLRWSDVTFYFTDERCVPITHPASNYGEAVDKFMKNPRIDLHQFRRIEGERADRDEAAGEYARMLPAALDIVLAELGADGHIAGLYPGSLAMLETERLVMPIQAPTRPVQRISVTPLVFTNALNVLVVATGRDRTASVARALGSTADIPANPGSLLHEATWFLDRDAARSLDALRGS